MVLVLQILLVLGMIFFIVLIVFRIKKKKGFTPLPENYKALLYDYVKFYRQLNEEGKEIFEERVKQFLASVKITGVNAVVEDLDIICIAAGAIIPVFAIPNWQYINLHRVLLYPGSFDADFDQRGSDRSYGGMVGTGALQNVMIISKWQLRQGFIYNNDAHNTAIHEFVHLIDKMDGSTDGVPELLLEKEYVGRWKNLIDLTILQIKNFESTIDMYGATNSAEFFAVSSEYFFEQPELLKASHPEVYEMLARIYKTG